MASQQVAAEDYTTAPIRSGSGNVHLYQAYLGKVKALEGGAIDVYIDDEAIRVGTENTRIGDKARTWYDGISYGRVSTSTGVAGPVSSHFHLAANISHHPAKALISLDLRANKNMECQLKIYTLAGKRIYRSKPNRLKKGHNTIKWPLGKLNPGAFILRVQSKKITLHRKWLYFK